MNFTKVKKYTKKACALGPYKTAHIVHNRLKNKLFETYWRSRAQAKKAHHYWKHITKKHSIFGDFASFLNTVEQKQFHFVQQIPITVQEVNIIEQADQFTQNGFDLLSSGLTFFDHIPWHIDFRLQKNDPTADCYFDAYVYYKDIQVIFGKTDQLVKDIKVPWELSRLQHFFVLAKAYQLTKDQKYVDTFTNHFNDWYIKNPFLLGPNWVCPMEVGLRAVNLILAFAFFKHANISSDFWQQFTCSLYDHLFYLEHNWEIYDGRTSNHYLSDLIGYFYLCYFFQDLSRIDEKTTWCYQELLKEFDKQVFDEGTDYEGSTCYHKLVTEIFYHFFIVGKELGFVFSESFEQKLGRMFEFMQWCDVGNDNLIQIGDNDSGKVTYWGIDTSFALSAGPKDQCIEGYERIKHFPLFGLSIIKTKDWHISLRHHAYQKRQPSGHFHNDVGSITLAYKGIPIFVDPGSYVYTPSQSWRNQFRSVAMHNTFYVHGKEPVSFNNESLFRLDLPENSIFEQNLSNSDQSLLTLHTQHTLYKRFGLQAERMVTFAEDTIIINDHWHKVTEHISQNIESVWNFILAPDIRVEKNENHIILHTNNNGSFIFESELNFDIYDTFVSNKYGAKKPSICLQAVKSIELEKEIIVSIKPKE